MVRTSACDRPCPRGPACGPVCKIRVPFYEFPYCFPKYYLTSPYPCYPGFGPCAPAPIVKPKYCCAPPTSCVGAPCGTC